MYERDTMFEAIHKMFMNGLEEVRDDSRQDDSVRNRVAEGERSGMVLHRGRFLGRCVAGLPVRHLSKERFVKKRKNRLLQVAGVLIGITGIVLIRALFEGAVSRPAARGTGIALLAAPSPTVAAVVTRHLTWADQQAAAGLDPQLNALREVFAEAKRGTRAFAEDALGFDSKWALITGYVRGNDDHRRYLAERFAARVFTAEHLEQVVKYSVQAYLTHLDNVDAMLLVNLRTDLANIPSNGFSSGMDPRVIEQSLSRAITEAVRGVEAEFPGAIGREIVSIVGGDIVMAAGTRLATSAGLLSAGATGGWVSAGGTLVLSIMIDYVVCWAWDKIADPCGELARKLDATLTQLEQIIIAGYGDEPGLRKRLLDYGARRGQARKAAIQSVVH